MDDEFSYKPNKFFPDWQRIGLIELSKTHRLAKWTFENGDNDSISVSMEFDPIPEEDRNPSFMAARDLHTLLPEWVIHGLQRTHMTHQLGQWVIKNIGGDKFHVNLMFEKRSHPLPEEYQDACPDFMRFSWDHERVHVDPGTVKGLEAFIDTHFKKIVDDHRFKDIPYRPSGVIIGRTLKNNIACLDYSIKGAKIYLAKKGSAKYKECCAQLMNFSHRRHLLRKDDDLRKFLYLWMEYLNENEEEDGEESSEEDTEDEGKEVKGDGKDTTQDKRGAGDLIGLIKRI